MFSKFCLPCSNSNSNALKEINRAPKRKTAEVKSIEVSDISPLMRAATEENVSSLVEMLSNKSSRATLFVKDFKGRTALDWARLCNNVAAVHLLRKAMTSEIADSRLLMMEANLDSHHQMVQENRAQAQELFKALQERNEIVTLSILNGNRLIRREIEALGQTFFTDVTDEFGYSPLMLAAGADMLDAVNLLIEMQVSISCVNKYGHSAFTFSCTSGNAEVAQLLLFKGADINHRTLEGRTGLHFACRYGKAKVVKVIFHYLFEKFAGFRALHSKNGYDPTRWTKYVAILDTFLNIRDNNNDRAFDLIPSTPSDLNNRLLEVTQHLKETRIRWGKFHGNHYEKSLSDTLSQSQSHSQSNSQRDSAVMDKAPLHVRISATGRALASSSYNSDVVEEESNPSSIAMLSSSLEMMSTTQNNESRLSIVDHLRGSKTAIISMSDGPPEMIRELLRSASSMKRSSQSPKKSMNVESNNEIEHGDSDFMDESKQNGIGIRRKSNNRVATMNDNQNINIEETPREQASYSGDDEISATPSVRDSLPGWSHDSDNLHAEGLNSLGNYSVYTSMPYTDELNAINELFEYAKERLAEWRVCGQREEEIAQSVPCWLHCGFIDKVEMVAVHIRKECPNRMITCSLCLRLVKLSEFDGHSKRECPKRKLGCPYAWEGCRELVNADHVDLHTQLRCKYRPVKCRKECGATMPVCKRESHEIEHCEKRDMKCDLCQSVIIAETYSHHLHHMCPNRMVKCKVGCGKMFKGKDVDKHQTYECKMPCRWNCGKVIGPLEKLVLHETSICQRRPYVCKYSCGMGGLMVQNAEEHELFQCLAMLIFCPNGCGQHITKAQYNLHVDPWIGSCPERLLRCPSNLIGWQVSLRKEPDVKGIVLMYKREPYDPEDLKMINSYEQNGIDKLYIRFGKRQVWVDYWEDGLGSVLPIEKVKHSGLLSHNLEAHIDPKLRWKQRMERDQERDRCDCGWITASALNEHLTDDCINRSIQLKGKHDQQIENFGGQAVAFKDRVAVAGSRHKLDSFVEFSWDNSCEHCAKKVSVKEMPDHLKNDCAMVILRCTRGCGLKLFRQNMDFHINRECPKRPMTCPQCLNDNIWAEDLDEHMINACTERFVECSWGCGIEDLTFSREEEHRLQQCGMRIVECSCRLTMTFDDYHIHSTAECKNMLLLCNQACGLKLPRDRLEYHMQHECANKTHFYSRFVSCHLGCGMRLKIREVLEHSCYHCPRRLSECPLGCGDSIQIEKLKLHLFFCPKRPICCEPDFKPCENFFYKWFYKETVADDGYSNAKASTVHSSKASSSITVDEGKIMMRSGLRMFGCTKHKGTALMSAVRADEFEMAEYISKVTEGKDLEFENIYGDTALTLACRLGKFNFVEILVQSGAYINYETSTGKTALIEACRAPVENMKIVEYLIQFGARVRYKTRKHSRSALDWALKLKYSETMRVLDLGGVVQSQSDLLFLAIGCGDIDKVREIVGDGDFYDPLNEGKKYADMERYLAEARLAARNVKELRLQLVEATDEVERLRAVKEGTQTAFEEADSDLNVTLNELNFMTTKLSRLCAVYERSANKLMRSDLEELCRMKKPELPVRIAAFAYGIIWGILDVKTWNNENNGIGVDDATYSMASTRIWWPVVLKQFSNSSDTLKRIKAYSLDRLLAQMAKPLLIRSRKLYLDLVSVVKGADYFKQVLHNTSVDTSLSITKPSTSLLVGASGASRPLPPIPSADVEATQLIAKNIENRADFSGLMNTQSGLAEAEQPKASMGFEDLDSDWDSDADDAGGGQWVKGEWVPYVRENASTKWYLRKRNSNKRTSAKSSENDQAKKSEDSNYMLSFNGRTIQKKTSSSSSNKLVILTPSYDPVLNRGGATPLVMVGEEGGRALVAPYSPMENRTAKKNRLDLSDDTHNDPVIDDGDSGSRHNFSKTDKGNNLAMVQAGPPANTTDTARSVEVATYNEIPVSETTNRGSIAKYNEDLQDENENEAWQFVKTLLVLLEAANELGNDRDRLFEVKGIVVRKGIVQEEKRVKHLGAVARFENGQKHRAEVDLNLIREMKNTRFKLGKAKLSREKLRVTRLLEIVSPNGHTAISYAAAHGNFEAVDELLSHGSTMGYQTNLIHMCASFIQLSYRIYRLSYFPPKQMSSAEKAQAEEKMAEKIAREEAGFEDTTTMGGSLQGSLENSVELSVESSIKGSIGGSKSAMMSANHQDADEGLSVAELALKNAKPPAALVEQIFNMRSERARLLRTIRFQRSRLRFPIPEAAYAGKWEVIKRVIDRRLLHYYFTNTWNYPLPPTPFIRHFNGNGAKAAGNNKRECYNILSAAAMGMNDLSAGTFVEGVGWVGPGDPHDYFGETQSELEKMWYFVEKERSLFIAERKRIRLISIEKKFQKTGGAEMAEAIRSKNFRRCIELAAMGISIDYETEEDCLTPLLAAAEEVVGSQGHIFMLNDDGRPCLHVEYLLDRVHYRPGINVETKNGHTAIIHACYMSRYHTLQVLLDRGADIKYQNKYGKTALHYAAGAGNAQCCRILIERDLSCLHIKDNDGLLPFETADEMGFTHILSLFSQYTGGNIGPVRIKRGTIEDTVTCPFGCKLVLLAHEVPEHSEICELRPVKCPYNCSFKYEGQYANPERHLLAFELDDHIAFKCLRRPVICELCGVMYEFCDENKHLYERCRHRPVSCELGCGKDIRFSEKTSHAMNCTYRLAPCPLQCSSVMKYVDVYNHTKEECENRRVPCILGCGAIIVLKNINKHCENVCKNRPATCQFCWIETIHCNKFTHEKSCHLREEPCPAKCGELVCIQSTKKHLEFDCSHRFVDCEGKCGLKVRYADMENHRAKQCTNRSVPCPNGCFVDDSVPLWEKVVLAVPYKHLELHLKFDCPKRPYRCHQCSNMVPFEHKQEHEGVKCTHRPVPCTIKGCLKVLPLADLDTHVHLQCRFRMVICAQGCGEMVQFLHLGKHLMQKCTRRKVECPFRCGAQLRAQYVDHHKEEVCPRRHGGRSTERSGEGSPFSRRTSSASLSLGLPGSPGGREASSPGVSSSRKGSIGLTDLWSGNRGRLGSAGGTDSAPGSPLTRERVSLLSTNRRRLGSSSSVGTTSPVSTPGAVSRKTLIK